MTVPEPPPDPGDVLARVRREELSRLVATLVRRFGDLDLAEDAAQDAMVSALRTWLRDGVPRSPLAWLTSTARNAALDRVRRDDGLARRLAELHLREQDRAPDPADAAALAADDLPDDRLAMLMGCCHPAIATADRIALMLRFVGGLSSAEVAQALLLPLPTVQARLTRAKKRIAGAGIPLEVPEDPAERERRLPLVLTAISLVFTEGYAASHGDAPIRRELTAEAIRLARITQGLLPGAAEPEGLLALLLLTEARAPARVDAEGVPVSLEEQDRGLWDRELLAEGTRRAERAAAMPGAGRFTIQAAIAAVHAEAADLSGTDWAQVVALYDLLLDLGEDPVVRMNRAIALGRRDGPASGLAALDALRGIAELERHVPFHAARGLTLAELGREEEARAVLATARELAPEGPDRRFLQARLRRLDAD